MTSVIAATGARSSDSGWWIWLIPLVLLGLLLLASRRRTQRTHQAQQSLAVGDAVSTTSGLLGRLVELDERVGTIEAAAGVRLRFDRRAILPDPAAADRTVPEDEATSLTGSDQASGATVREPAYPVRSDIDPDTKA